MVAEGSSVLSVGNTYPIRALWVSSSLTTQTYIYLSYIRAATSRVIEVRKRRKTKIIASGTSISPSMGLDH